ncbi:methylated-DNA--[protein]-cysteine S-methyltransferase [Coralloluteibacterium stylophorae]|uniref:methylated-DNA--[protein]-cysteine S-methyltransferase n=1 Tax=Coralloluteibacterium stylophorae TaxID=1776034 RepID=A0A8J7VR59_9GAMM|nr:methylated-DNA--[protein]-cysteine S-methyltransferase [Coralloluteibacterium stylophorae]MBS7458238.1 methylated-DNA--[protein]-cysteine S-methyltransferase [Coralloluteibacterium stylophorae]
MRPAALSPAIDPAAAASEPAIEPRLLAVAHRLDQADASLAELAAVSGWSPAHLQRRFRAAFGLSPAQYRAARRLRGFKRALRAGDDVTGALYGAGYGSPSRIYEHGAARLGMTPARYGRGGLGVEIRWCTLDSGLTAASGRRALVAATVRGICAVLLGADDAGLERTLRAEFPRAALEAVDCGRDAFLAPRIGAVAQALRGASVALDLDLLGTAFEVRVWQALMAIPAGASRSYAEIAAAIGAPGSARAVGRACGRNRVALVVPCHRVRRGDGSLGGYRWGVGLKQALLDREQGA